jgi:MoxR-like ATPase
MAKARAIAGGRDYVLPEDVQAVAVPVLAHRLIVAPESRAAGVIGEETVQDALDQIPVPV